MKLRTEPPVIAASLSPWKLEIEGPTVLCRHEIFRQLERVCEMLSLIVNQDTEFHKIVETYLTLE